MKPDWDKLMDDFKDSKTALVADVDCTAEGKDLCEKNDVRGYPTIKYGDPAALQDYDGGRSYDDFKKFADENLGASCGPGSMDLCDEEKKAVIEKFMKMSDGKLDAKVRKAEKSLEKLEADFKNFTDGLQHKYEEHNKKKDESLKALKDSGLGLMKSVLAFKSSSAGKSEL